MFKNFKLKIVFLFLVFLFLVFSFLLFANKALASSVGLRISPSVIQIQAKAPSDITESFTIENTTERGIDLEIMLKPFKAGGEAGEVEYPESTDFPDKPDPGLLQKVKILANDTEVTNLTLSPFEKKNLTLSLHLPAEEKPSDYYFSILFVSIVSGFSEENTEKKTTIKTRVGIAQHVILSIKDSSRPTATIEQFKTPFFASRGPVEFELKVKNPGQHFITPYGVITVKNIFNQIVGNIELTKTPILAKSSRIIPSRFENGLLLGPYTAELTLSLSNPATSKNSFRQTLHFFVIPFKQVLELSLIIIMIVFVIKGIKRYR